MTSHAKYIDTAFLQLSFAIKLLNYIEANHVNKDEFDSAITIEDRDNRVCLPANEFESLNDLVLAAQNNVSICFGTAAISLWEAIREKDVYPAGRLPNPLKTHHEKLAALVYMIRCCFAHGMAIPKWDLRLPKYRIVYSVGSKQIDLTASHQTPFDYKSIGGYETLWLLRDEATRKNLL
jgi:hypothetical protein